MIPYEKIKTYEDLDVTPEGEFFSKTKFYSTLRNTIIDDQSYGNVKRFWKTLRLEKVSDLNHIYNFQDTIILCEIFENRATEMMNKNFVQFSKMHFCQLTQWLHASFYFKGNNCASNAGRNC